MLHTIKLEKGKKIYFISDQHLGAPDREKSLPREKTLVDWLSQIQGETQVLFILGDLFDYWMEYRKVVPKGFVRILGKLAELADGGMEIHYFVGNHDLWMSGYFEEELGIPVYHKSKEFLINDKKFFIGHGDGLGPGDLGYKRMKKVFTNPLCKWLFQRLLHPDFGMRLGQYLSIKNKIISGKEDFVYNGPEGEWLYHYAKRKLEKKHRDYFVFGHRHLPLEIPLNNNSFYFNIGDWITHFTYGVFDGAQFSLEKA